MTEMTFEALLEQLRISQKNYDIEKICDAYELADAAHKEQTRHSGEPYISHPVAVATILFDLGMDSDTLSAALLHDVVEDTDVKLEEIKLRFGSDVAKIVDGVTKIRKINLNPAGGESKKAVLSYDQKEEMKNESIRKTLLAMSEDERVILLKLADRLHNMRTLGSFTSDEKRKRIAYESLSLYAPLAYRLGIAHIKEELENLSLFYLDRIAYEEIEKDLSEHKEEREAFIKNAIEQINMRLGDMNPPPTIEGRIKGIYSLYKKMYTKQKDLSGINDLCAIRVILGLNGDCFAVMGIIHDIFTPVPGTFKDYISAPKQNGYQSIHTVVSGPGGQPFEVQIRTLDMHNTARFGVAAHWKYKSEIESSKASGSANPFEAKFGFVRSLVEQQQIDNTESFTSIIKNEFSDEEVRVFTPDGDVKLLRKGVTVLDFAYAIHTDVGNKMKSAKVNGNTVSFDHKLKTGDSVKIETSDEDVYGPNRSWLAYATTIEAKNKIKDWLKTHRKEENISSGRGYVESILRREGILQRETKEYMRKVLDKLGKKHRFRNRTELYAAIGYGKVSLEEVALWIMDAFKEKRKADLAMYQEEQNANKEKIKDALPSAGVIVDGIEDCHTKLANCCNPIWGDEIVGFTTRNYGVSIHKKECANVALRARTVEDKSRLVQVRWPENYSAFCTAVIEITASDRNGLLFDVNTAISKDPDIRITSSRSKILENNNAHLKFELELPSANQLERLMKRLSEVEGIISIERTVRS